MDGDADTNRLYALGVWPIDPSSPIGVKRYNEATDIFKKIVGHEWIQEIAKKGRARILEICAGAGIGGVALSCVLLDEGVDVELVLTDVRENDLAVGEKWGREQIGDRIRVVKSDARSVHRIGSTFDIGLMYGFSAPHFCPWDMVKLQASLCECLSDGGVFLMDEGDRIYSIFYVAGYKSLMPERVDKERAVVSMHAGYDFTRGVFKRAYMDLLNPSSPVMADMYFWNLSELMTITWMFFRDVDLSETGRGRGIIIGKHPRRALSIRDFEGVPRVFSEREAST